MHRQCVRIACCSILSDCQEVIQRETPRNGGVAQLGEHLPCKQGVMGSIPIISTTDGKSDTKGEERRDTPKNLHGLIAQVVRARA